MINLSVQDILDRKEKIEGLLKKYYIEDCKIFGEALEQKGFPVLADIIFLLTPGKFTTSYRWELLKKEVRELFPLKSFVEFYTLNMLDNMVELKYLKQADVEFAKTNAISLAVLANEPSVHSTLSPNASASSPPN